MTVGISIEDGCEFIKDTFAKEVSTFNAIVYWDVYVNDDGRPGDRRGWEKLYDLDIEPVAGVDAGATDAFANKGGNA